MVKCKCNKNIKHCKPHRRTSSYSDKQWLENRYWTKTILKTKFANFYTVFLIKSLTHPRYHISIMFNITLLCCRNTKSTKTKGPTKSFSSVKKAGVCRQATHLLFGAKYDRFYCLHVDRQVSFFVSKLNGFQSQKHRSCPESAECLHDYPLA